MSRPRSLALAAVLSLALVGAGCADTSDEAQAGSGRAVEDSVFANGLVGVEEPDGDPVAGGSVEFVTFGEARSLDPTQTLANGTSGGIEMAALFDVLLRFDPETGDYEPWLAESMEPDADLTTWTMTLREDVRFSDGTPLDAAAVVTSLERYIENDGDQASLWERNVQDVQASDERTVVFVLNDAWEGFEYLLATGPGMVVGAGSDAGGEFTPVGAGPFVLNRMAPQEELVLTANPDYWRGTPPLEQVRFTTIAGDPAKVDMLAQGQADMAYLRKPDAVRQVRESGIVGSMEINSVGEALLLNHRDGAATADPRVRQAISLAIDRDLVNQRIYEGQGIPEAGVFAEVSQWSTENVADGFDPDRARELLEEAKADGYDGTISFLGVATGSEPVALALKALLENVGFTMELDYVSSPPDLVEKIYVKQDYEMSIWGFGIPDGAPYPELFESFHSESTGNVGAYADPAMDEAVEELRTATTEEEQQAAADAVQEVWDDTVPAISLMANPEFVAWQPGVHAVVPSIDGLVLLGAAWEE